MPCVNSVRKLQRGLLIIDCHRFYFACLGCRDVVGIVKPWGHADPGRVRGCRKILSITLHASTPFNPKLRIPFKG